jgi:hypothetical protein
MLDTIKKNTTFAAHNFPMRHVSILLLLIVLRAGAAAQDNPFLKNLMPTTALN